MKLLRAVLLGCLVLFGGCASSNSGQKFIGKYAPYTRLTMLDGSYVGLEEYKGKTVVLVFWADWCTHSRPVMLRLSELARTLNRKDVVFIAASVDKADKLEKVKERVIYQKLDSMQQAFSGNEVYDEAYMAFEGERLPYIIIIDPKGVVVNAGNNDDIVYEALGIKK